MPGPHTLSRRLLTSARWPVGVLASDDFASLPPGKYVVYSGVYGTRKEAAAALKPLKSKFPQAKVVEVSDSGATASSGNFAGKKKATLNQKDLENLNNLSGNDYEKQSRKLPTTTVLPGKPPPADGKAPGGGGGGTVIK